MGGFIILDQPSSPEACSRARRYDAYKKPISRANMTMPCQRTTSPFTANTKSSTPDPTIMSTSRTTDDVLCPVAMNKAGSPSTSRTLATLLPMMVPHRDAAGALEDRLQTDAELRRRGTEGDHGQADDHRGNPQAVGNGNRPPNQQFAADQQDDQGAPKLHVGHVRSSQRLPR